MLCEEDFEGQMIMNILPWKEVAVSSVRSVLMNGKNPALEDVIREFESYSGGRCRAWYTNSVVLTAEYMKA